MRQTRTRRHSPQSLTHSLTRWSSACSLGSGLEDFFFIQSKCLNYMAKMSEEFVQLKWNTHKSTFLENLSDLRDKQIFTDVTLSCGDQFYPAHRLVLSSCSTFLAQALGVASCRSPVLLLHGIGQTTLEQLLMFMYDGQVTISRNSLPSLLKAAQWLGVKGLESSYDNFSDMCETSTESDHTDEESSSAQFNKFWRQFLAALASNRGGSGNPDDMTSTLQQIARKIIEQGNTLNNNDTVISQVAPLDPSSEFEEDSIELKPDPNAEGNGYRDSDFGRDNNPCFLPQPVSIGDIPEHFLDVQCNSQKSNTGENSFEGWNKDADLNSRKNLLFLKKEMYKTDFEVDPELLSSEVPGNEVGKVHQTWCEGGGDLLLRGENLLSAGPAQENVDCDKTSSKRGLRCKHCKKFFTIRVELAKHLRIHHNSNDRVCFSCNKEFVTAKNYNLHMKLHDSDSVYSCSKCDFMTHNKRSLNKHLSSHENENCVSVQKSAQEETLQLADQDLEAVMKGSPHTVLPSTTMESRCQKCWKTFKNHKLLQQHKVSDCGKVLVKKAEHQCPMCNYVGTRRRSVIDHMCTHTGNYPFCCSFCTFKSTRKRVLQLHINKRHTHV